jgi:hypothetical protein
MCIDAPGSNGFGYYPHMATSEKSAEPEKHKLLKTKATGRRQEYRYNVKYFGGDIKSFDLIKSPSLPFSMSREDFLKRIGYVTRQRFDKSYFKTLPTVLSNVKRILRHRQLYAAKMPSWTHCFQQDMPQHVDDNDFQPFESPLLRIVEDRGGPIQV